MSAADRGARGANSGSSCSAVNQSCHGWTGHHVPRNNGHVMEQPSVYAIYWDTYFQPGQDPGSGAVDLMNQFFRDILTSSFMEALRQYGVGHGQLVGYSVVPVSPDNPPPKVLTSEDIGRYLTDWIDGGIVTRRPDPNESNLLYVIFTPQTTHFQSDGPSECIGGEHDSSKYGNPPGDNNLFWAAVQEWHHDLKPLPGTAREFVDSCSWLVSHEMVEAFTNRDGQGYQIADDCEIGDLCECAMGSDDEKAPIIKAEVRVKDRVWYVEPYWDNKNKSCYPLHIVPRKEAPVEYYEMP